MSPKRVITWVARLLVALIIISFILLLSMPARAQGVAAKTPHLELYFCVGVCLLGVLLLWGTFSMGQGGYCQQVPPAPPMPAVPPFSERGKYIAARMKADDLYTDWLDSLPSDMDNGYLFEREKKKQLEKIASETGLTLKELKFIYS